MLWKNERFFSFVWPVGGNPAYLHSFFAVLASWDSFGISLPRRERREPVLQAESEHVGSASSL